MRALIFFRDSSQEHPEWGDLVSMDWENQSPDFEYGSDRQISDERLKHCEENCGVVAVVIAAVVVLLCFEFPFLVGKGATQTFFGSTLDQPVRMTIKVKWHQILKKECYGPMTFVGLLRWPTSLQLTSKHLEISGFLNWNPLKKLHFA